MNYGEQSRIKEGSLFVCSFYLIDRFNIVLVKPFGKYLITRVSVEKNNFFGKCLHNFRPFIWILLDGK